MKDMVHQYSLFIVPFLASQVQMTFVYLENGIKVYPKWFSNRSSKIVLIIWTLFITIGIWRSAENYNGNVIWIIATFLFLSYRIFALRLIFF